MDPCMVYLHIVTHSYHKRKKTYMDAMDVFFLGGRGIRGGIICFSTCYSYLKSTICAEFVDRF